MPIKETTDSAAIAYYDYTINNPIRSNIYCTQQLPWDCQEIYYCPYLFRNLSLIKKVEMLKENKVMRFTFEDNTIIKIICNENDIFNFNYAFYLAYAKYLYKDELLPHGIEQKAKELMDIKLVNKLVKRAKRTYFNDLKLQEKAEKVKRESEEIRKRRIAKKIRKKEKKRQEMIKTVTTATVKTLENR